MVSKLEELKQEGFTKEWKEQKSLRRSTKGASSGKRNQENGGYENQKKPNWMNHLQEKKNILAKNYGNFLTNPSSSEPSVSESSMVIKCII